MYLKQIKFKINIVDLNYNDSGNFESDNYDIILSNGKIVKTNAKYKTGNIAKGLENGDIPKEIFKEELTPHLKNFVDWEGRRYTSHLLNKKEYENENINDLEFKYEFNVEPWINYQKANEFNPIHSHGGLISSVLYIDVPEEIAQENIDGKSNMACAGQIEFMFGTDELGSNGTHKIVPKTGDILLFHAKLKHCVYPFKSDVTRISMSFNVGNIQSSKPVPMAG